MTQFLGVHLNKLDSKGRVSVPAAFRAALRGEEQTLHVILRPSHSHDCVEGWPPAVFEALAQPLDRLDLFSEAHDDLAATLFGDAHRCETDREGRVLLPDTLVAHAGLTETVAFLGLGRTFQIWEPAAAERRRADARARVRERGLTLPVAT